MHRDGVERVLGRALADGPSSDDELWFPGEQLLPVHELAARWGDAHGQRIYMYPVSMRYWWSECARRASPHTK